MAECKRERTIGVVRALGNQVGGLIVVIAAIIFPVFLSEFHVYILCLIGINAIGALGLNILVGYTDQISLGHASFVGIGAYTTAILSSNGFPVWLTLPSAVTITSLVGFAVGLPCLRLKGLYLAVATLAFAWAIPELILKSPSLTGGFSGISTKEVSVIGISFKEHLHLFYYFVLILVLLVVWIVSNVRNSKFGRAFIALRDSEEGAKAMGINLNIYKTLAFVLSSALAGIAGNLYAYLIGTVTPYDFDLWYSIYFLVAIVIGGMGSIPGSLLGGAFITLVPIWLSGLRNLPNIVFGLALILVVLLLPGGLIGFIKYVLGRCGRIMELRSEDEPVRS